MPGCRIGAGWLCAGLLLALLTAEPARSGTLAPGLERFLADHGGSDQVTVLVVMREQADVPALDRDLRRQKAAFGQRHAAIVGALQRTAAGSQRSLLTDLAAAKAGGRIGGYTPHWLINAVVVTATPAAVRDLAARDDVLRVEADLVAELIAPVASWAPDNQPRGKAAAGIGIAPGVVAVGARRVWDELGFDGSGVLVGLIDSGADLNHPAYAARWQGNFVPAAEAWLDAAQIGSGVPVDPQGHGTHVLGTMTGRADGDTIGVAPGAHWIATNGILAASGIFDNAIMASLEFMADPDGDPTTTDDVPDVVNNSWGVNESFAGYLDCDSRWWDLIDNCEAAGVVMVWAAGNEGPIAGTVRSPADRAANPYNCFSVGSTSNHAPFVMSDFSSRGPSGCGGAYAIKPEVCAPGDTIYSALPGGGYIIRSGTSMATPHVAGVVALMRQANPDLDVVSIKQILMESARDIGLLGEDNDAGHGLIDAYAAVRAAMGGIGTVSGTVTAADTGLPVPGAVVTRTDGYNRTIAAADGGWSLTILAGPATFAAAKFGYFANEVSVIIPDGGTVPGDIVLTPQPVAEITGIVRGPDLLPVAGATVTAEGTPVAPALTDGSGAYTLVLPLAAGAPYSLRAVAAGLGYQVQQVELTGPVGLDFDLPELTWEDFESGGFLSYFWQFSGNYPWQVTDLEAFEGQYSARGADIAESQSTQMFIDYYVSAAGELVFRFKVSSEPDFDFLRFELDGQVVGAWSGEIDWTRFAVAVAKGHHTFRWIYAKDEAVSMGEDTAWLDLIEFPQTGVELFPGLGLDVVSVPVTLPQGTTASREVTITSTGGEELQFTAATVPLGKAANPRGILDRPAPSLVPASGAGPRPAALRAKGAKDSDPPATAAANGSGGPDSFGYTWLDSDDPAGPVFSWQDIGNVGTEITAADDMSFGPFALGFPLLYYGEVWTSLRISTNGFLSFTSTGSPYVNPVLPDAAEPNNVIAPFWDDLNPLAGGRVLYWADPDADRFIVQFEDVPRYDSSATETFQVILQGSGAIVCQYLTVSETGHCTVGIENVTGDDGLTVVANTDGYLRDGLAVRFEPPGFLPWVRVSPLAGAVAPGQSAVLRLAFDAGAVAVGTYVAVLQIAANDPDHPLSLVPLILTVTEPSPVPEPDLPRAVSLAGVVPNPFNPRTEIRYALPREQHVVLRVHDVRGHLVRQLVDGRRPAGLHAVVWDGCDDRGRNVASGTYYARLSAGGVSEVRAMALIR